MKALSVKQPWAHLIAEGFKTIEIRTWNTKYRGLLLIVASKKPDYPGHASGQSVAICRLVDCRKEEPRDWEFSHVRCYGPPSIPRYSWILEEVIKTPWIEMEGRLRLYEVTEDFWKEMIRLGGRDPR